MGLGVRIVATTVAVVLSAGAGTAGAAKWTAYATALNYATPALAIGQGDSVDFTNLNPLAQHDLASDDGKFTSKLAGMNETVAVEGVEKLAPGAYPFHCTLHTWMRGALNVAPVKTGDGVPGLESVGTGSVPCAGGTAPDPIDLAPQAAPKPLGPAEWPVYGR